MSMMNINETRTRDEIRKLFDMNEKEYRALMAAVYSGNKPDIRPLLKYIFDKVSDVIYLNNTDLEWCIKQDLKKSE